jgi:predicted nucleic acid-binding protein
MHAIRGLLDTSIFIALETGRPLDTNRSPADGSVSIITIGEFRLGILAARDATTRASRLSTFLDASELNPLPIDENVAEAWAQLRITLRDAHVKMSVNDSWIAATAMAHNIPVITQDGDFVEGLGFDIIRI